MTPPTKEGGELPFIRCEYFEEDQMSKSVLLMKMPLEACVEMVMHYWGTPPTQDEVRSLALQSIGKGESVYEIIKRHKLSFLFIASLDMETIKKILQLRIPIIAFCNIGNFQGIITPFNTQFLLKEFKDGRFVFNDPLTKASLEMDADLFLNAYWLPTDTLALIIFPPSKRQLLKNVIPTPCIKEANELSSLERPEGGNFTERIIRQLREKLNRKPSHYLAYLLGWRLSREGDEEGLVWLKKAYEMNPLPFYRAEYAIAHCYLHRNEEALRLLREFIKENPKYIALPNVFFHLCYLLSKEGREEEIKKLYQEASEIAPPHLLASLVEIYHQTLPSRKEQIKFLQEFTAKYPWATWFKAIGSYLLISLLGEGRWEEAEKLLKAEGVKGPQTPEEWFMLIQAMKYISKGQKKKAEEIYHQLEEKDEIYKMMLAEKMGKWKEVLEESSILIERFTAKEEDPYERKAWRNGGKLGYLPIYINAAVKLGDYKSAKKAIEDFVNIYENNVVLGYERYACYAYALGGLICYRDGEKERAREWLLKAYHSPYFKELDPLMVRDVKKALKEFGGTGS